MFLMVMLSGQWVSSYHHHVIIIIIVMSLSLLLFTSSRVSGSGVTEPMLTPEVGDAGSGLITQSRSWHEPRQTNNHHGYEKSQDRVSGVVSNPTKRSEKLRKSVVRFNQPWRMKTVFSQFIVCFSMKLCQMCHQTLFWEGPRKFNFFIVMIGKYQF